MSSAPFSIELLGAQHDRTSLTSGVAELDRYFRERASQDMRRHIAAVFVMVDHTADRVAGYYSLSASSLERSALPDDVSRGLPRYRFIPAILLGRLAVDERYRGQGLGGVLLVDALRRALISTTEVAAYAVVVDSIDEIARAFYEHYGFIRFPDDELRLFLPMDSIAKLVAVP